MKTRNLSVLAVLPVLLLASCTSSSPLSENDTAETKQAYENLETDDLSKVTVTEYRYEGDTLYSRSVIWNGEKKLPSLLLALAREDKRQLDTFFIPLPEKPSMLSPIFSKDFPKTLPKKPPRSERM